MNSEADTTKASRIAKNDNNFHGNIKVKFSDETGEFRSLITNDGRVDLRLYRSDNGSKLRIEIGSPEHDSLIFRRDLNECTFKEDQYFKNQELTFEFKKVYDIVVEFVRSMQVNKQFIMQCVVRKPTPDKSTCEIGLINASMTSKPMFKIQLVALSGSDLIKHLEKINDLTKERYEKLLEKYRGLKNVEKQLKEMFKQIEDFKCSERKHWAEKTQHQKRELALLGMSDENNRLREKLDELDLENRNLREDYGELQRQLEEAYEINASLERELKEQPVMLNLIEEAHLKTKTERDQLRDECKQLRKERDQFKSDAERLRNGLSSSINESSRIQSSIQSSRTQREKKH